MVLLTIAVVAGVAAVASGALADGMGEPESSIPARALPPGAVTGQDVVDLRFVQGLRGYRMDQVDAAMDRLAAEIDRLRVLAGEAEPSSAVQNVPAASGDTPAAPEPSPEKSSGATGVQ